MNRETERAPMPPKLSICMPTYNRSNLIGRALESVRQLHDLGVDLEVVIGDNASTDDTAIVVAELAKQYSYIRYFRNSRNFGSIINYQLCLKRARGEFALYLADDDHLLPTEIFSTLKTLEQRPDISMAVLAVEVWDDMQDQLIAVWPNFPEPLLLGQGDFANALRLFLKDIVLPEIVVMRRSTIDSMLAEQTNAYYAFVQFAHGLSSGNVWFPVRPGYRFHMSQQASMDTAGWNIAVGSFEEHKAGLEYCLLHMHKKSPLTTEMRDSYQRQIENYSWRRMFNAARRLSLRGEHRKAVALLQRLQLWATDETMGKTIRSMIASSAPSACAESIVFLAQEAFSARYLAIHNDRNDPLFTAIATGVMSHGALQVIGLNDAVRLGVQEQTLVLAQRADLVAATHCAGFPLPQIIVPEQMMLECAPVADILQEAAP